MSRWIHFIARLYPRSWRERYGAEYAALLEDVRPDGRTAADVLTGALAMHIRTWKSWSILAASALVGVIVVMGAFATIPKAYRATAMLRVEGQGNQSDTTHPIQSIAQQALSGDKLVEMITTEGLYLPDRSKMPLNEVADKMRKSILIVRTSTAHLVIGFDYHDPQLAQKVTQDLVARFMEANLQQHQVTLQLLNPASLPQSPIRNYPSIIGFGFACFLLMWGALSGIRWISTRRHA